MKANLLGFKKYYSEKKGKNMLEAHFTFIHPDYTGFKSMNFFVEEAVFTDGLPTDKSIGKIYELEFLPGEKFPKLLTVTLRKE